MKHLTVVVVCCLSLNACATFDVDSLHLNVPSVAPALPLSLQIDQASLVIGVGSSATGYEIDEVVISEGTKIILYADARGKFTTSTSMSFAGIRLEVLTDDRASDLVKRLRADEPVQLVSRLLTSQLPHLLDATSQSRGTLKASLTTRKALSTNAWWLAPSIATLSLINLFGCPAVSQSCEIGIELEVLDELGNSLGKYEGRGTATEYTAPWWGHAATGQNYGLAHAVGADNIHPLTQATIVTAVFRGLQQATDALLADAPRLMRGLESVNAGG